MSFNIPIKSGIIENRGDNLIKKEGNETGNRIGSDEEVGKSEGDIGQDERDVIESLISSTLSTTSSSFDSFSGALQSSSSTIAQSNERNSTDSTKLPSTSSATITLPPQSTLSSQKPFIPSAPGTIRKRQPSLEPIDSFHLSPASIAASSKISCLECRASKTRCSGGDICERCKRLTKECIYKEHRRGRFSDSKRVQHLERVVQSLLGQLRSLQAQNSREVQGSRSSIASTSKEIVITSSHSGGNSPPSVATAPALPDQQNDLWKILDSRSNSPLLDAQQTTLEGLLSYPLRLLAHFGKDVGLNEGESENDRHPISHADYQDTVLNAQIGDYTPTITPSMSAAAVSRKNSEVIDHTSFLQGLRSVKLDRFDPIDMGIISQSKAEQLFRSYFDLLESSVAMFDSHLHTFDFVRTTSSFLLTTMCFLASLFDIESNSLSKRLEEHINKTILPAILTQDYRSVEIVQSFVLLANYHPQITTLSQDRSWLFIGYASRIGWELGMNISMQNALARFPNDRELIRRVRNRERTWLNVWIAEMALCELMGMAPMMRFDPIVISSSSWHLHPESLAADYAIVALVQLRLILARQAEMFERFILSNHTQNDPNGLVEMMKATYRQSIEQLDAWSNAWSQDPYVANISSHHPRFRRAKICYWYARAMSASRALRFTFDTQTSFSMGLYLDIFNACTAFLYQILHNQNATAFQYSNNCSVNLPTYCCVVCLSLVGIIKNSSIDPSRLNIDVLTAFDLITKISDSLNRAASITPHRRGAASNYGPFLQAVLQKTKEKYNIGKGKQSNRILSSAQPQGEPSQERQGKDKKAVSPNTQMPDERSNSNPSHNPSLVPSSPIVPVQQGYSNQYNMPTNIGATRAHNQFPTGSLGMGLHHLNATNGMFNEATASTAQTQPMYWQGTFPSQSGIMQVVHAQINPNHASGHHHTAVGGSGDRDMAYSNDMEGAQLYNLIFGQSNYYTVQQQQQQQQQQQHESHQNQKPS